MIGIGIRNNLLYPIMLLIFTSLRQIISIVIDEKIIFECPILLTLIMFSSEFIFGLILFIYNIKIIGIRRKTTYKGIKLIQAPLNIKHPDSNFKIYFLIFEAGFFDFIEFVISTYYVPKLNNNISYSLDIHLRSILITLFSAFCCYYVLKIPIYKHQIFSLLIIFICFVIILIFEVYFAFVDEKIDLFGFLHILFLILIVYFFNSFIDIIEKYLLEYNFINPFKILMFEGLFGIILTFTTLFIKEGFKEIKNIYNYTNSNNKFISLLICLIFYFLFSGGRNVYRLETNRIYSPMTWTLINSLFDPFLIIYYSFFSSKKVEEKSHIYFIINFIISIIIVLCSSVYNEIFVLFCCRLEQQTYNQICLRAKQSENMELPFNDNLDDEDNHDDKIVDEV